MNDIVSVVSQGNQALKFIDERVADVNYRGKHSSEHNRYTMEKIHTILFLFNKYAPNNTLMKLRDNDISKRPNNLPDEIIYAQFCEESKKLTRIGTQDAMRKTLFVDFNRMGFIHRFNKNKEIIKPFKREAIKYACLSKQGQKFVNSSDIDDRFFIFSKGLDILLYGYISLLLEIFTNEHYDIDKISIYEFMFFVSAVNTETSFKIDTRKCIELIKSFRLLSIVQNRSVIDKLRTYMIPQNYTGDKTDKRDFHNWQNEAEQVFSLLNQTVYFEQRKDKIIPKQLIRAKNADNIKTKFNRSADEKFQYFKNHKITRTDGFELHHVVPLSLSENINQFKLLDKWKNMIYIDGFSHAKITQNNNRNVVMEKDETTILLSDYNGGNTIELKIKDNIVYSPTKIVDMLNYNKQLLKMVE